MPGQEVSVRKPDGTTGAISVDPVLIQKALAKGWQVGDVPVRKPDGTPGVISAAKLQRALDKGWSLDSYSEVELPAGLGYDLTPNQTPATAPADEGPSLVTPEAARGYDLSLGVEAPMAHADTTPRSILEGSPDQALAGGEAINQFVTSPEYLRAKAQSQAYREAHDAGLTTGKGLANTALTAAEGWLSAPFLGWDQPAAALEGVGSALGSQVAAAQEAGAYELTGRSAPQLTSTRGVGGEARPLGVGEQAAGELAKAEQAIQGREAVNPGTRLGSEVAGTVATSIVSGGTGALAKTARWTPTMAAERLGEKLGMAATRLPRWVGAHALTTPLPDAARLVGVSALKSGVSGAVQGGLQGAAEEVNRAWLNEDYDLTAERLVASSAQGAGLGALLGMTVGAATGAASARAPRMDANGAPIVELGPEPKANKPAREYQRPEGLQDRTVKMPERTRKKLVQGAYGEIRDDLNDFVQTRQALDNLLDLEDKKRWILANADTTPATHDMVSQIREELGLDKATLEELANEGAVLYDNAGGTASLKRLVNQLDSIENDLFEKAATQGIHEGDIYIALDQMKRDAAKVVVNARTRNPYLFDVMEPKVNSLIENLKNDKQWSPVLADMQRRTNDTWSRALTSSDDTDLRSMWGELGEQLDANKWERPKKVNDSWLDAHLNAIGKPSEAQRIEAVQRYLDSNAIDAQVRASVYGGPKARELAQQLVNARRRLNDRMGTVQYWNANTVDATQPSVLGVISQVPGANWLLSKAFDAVREKSYQQSARTVQEIDAAARMKGALEKPVSPAAVRAVVSPKVQEWLNKVESNQDDEDKQSMIMLDQVFGESVMDAARAQEQRRRDFVRAKLGAGPQARAAAERYAAAALEPVEALKRVSAGTGTREDRETLQVVFPRLWDSFVAKAAAHVEKSGATYDQRVRASRILGVPLDPSLDPDRYRALQEQASSADVPAQGSAAPSTARLYQRG